MKPNKRFRAPARRRPITAGAFLFGVFFGLTPWTGKGQTASLPLEIRQDETVYNEHDARGAPIAENGPSLNPATPGQFSAVMPASALAAPTTPGGFVAGRNLAENALSIGLPRTPQTGQPTTVLSQAAVGIPVVGEKIRFLFGGELPPPTVDENGDPLPEEVDPSAYWLAEPHTTNNHDGASYYWSPHAEKLFATQAGSVSVTWRKAQPATQEPADYDADPSRYFVDAGNYYALTSASYLVSGNAVKTPRRMYWTEGVFQDTGKPVDVPGARVGAIQFIYSERFPERAAEEFRAPGQSDIFEGQENRLEETRTIWFDHLRSQILAYNQEGRVFMEILGDASDDGVTREHLGFEIVDVRRQPRPFDLTVELGEPLVAFETGSEERPLSPSPLDPSLEGTFFTQHVRSSDNQTRYFATGVTENVNDVLFYWLESGIEGLSWPERFVRYTQRWPVKLDEYQHYVRAQVTTEAEAEATGVPLPQVNSPTIEHQDILGFARATITSDSRLYTRLDPSAPAHRTLVRLISGEEIRFLRVFSWLDDALLESAPVEVAEGLSFWSDNEGNLLMDQALTAPRVVRQPVVVGQEILAPNGETGFDGGETFQAGYIQPNRGNSYSVSAYKDPFALGFEEANQGAIIPINAIPGANELEVWWFRESKGDSELGFLPSWWPSAVGIYEISWPSEASEIVMASNDGSGPLTSLESQGRVYYQNDPSLPGYNPNEEHALLVGGQVYALRDDLNIVDEVGYSSHPFILLEHPGSDGRPDMAVFKVLREKPSEGVLFDYVVEAGGITQAPMPLPLLAAPVLPSGLNANHEIEFAQADLPQNWDADRDNGGAQPFGHYDQFTFEDRKNVFWLYRGRHAGPPPLEAGSYDVNSGAFVDTDPSTADVVDMQAAEAVVGLDFLYHVHASRRIDGLRLTAAEETPLPLWLRISGMTLVGRPADADEGEAVDLDLIVQDVASGDEARARLRITTLPAAGNIVVAQGPLEIPGQHGPSGAQFTYVGRAPYLATTADGTNSFQMRFYYRTLDGFAWPGLANPPVVDSVVPFLRPIDNEGAFVGAADSALTDSLPIIYRPVWPVDVPTLSFGDTLLSPKQGLPAIRGQSSLEVVYQQSIASDLAPDARRPSVLLFDPTREKSVDLGDHDLEGLPGSVNSQNLRGLSYFPNLPPHLVDRLFYDPNRSEAGHLVFRGEFKDEVLGEDYLLLNVLKDQFDGTASSDITLVKALTPTSDGTNKSKWDAAVDALSTTVETFYEDPTRPGVYIPNPNQRRSIDIHTLATVEDANDAVDSYALSAAGPGRGFVTLMAGNGAAFTPAGEPVSVHIFRVETPQATGSIKVLPSPNPLNELITLRHSLDLGGEYSAFEYDWRIAPPVDGLPLPVTEEMTGWTALGSGRDLPSVTLGGAGIQVLIDNYLVMRYRPKSASHPLFDQWSDWTDPQLAEGWIKRALAGINPFNQRLTDLFNNAVNTDVSLLTQAGTRWEGDVALSLDNINDFGLIAIYETILNRGKELSIEAGIDFGPANDALLLAAGYINDLYMILGNEAFADAANPTISIGSQNGEIRDIATALFSFRGQLGSLLEEELALLRGRDDFLLPGVEVSPVYNRLIWNYTRGIDAGEVVYATNYNIQEDPNLDPDGVINASDAAHMFPQGHGDAYGHYLMALKGYFSLLFDESFTWAPRTEAVSILGQPVSVDYLDERKFATAASSLARTGNQVLELTWKQDYQSDPNIGWEHLSETRTNDRRDVTTTRNWGVDHWATRVGQGGYFNWVIGNAMLPATDPDPTHEGIQKIDRTTVTELRSLPDFGVATQTLLDQAEGRLTPLGFPEDSVPFDIDPNALADAKESHFEQIFERAKVALNNAYLAYEDANDLSQLMRIDSESLNDMRNAVAEQELAYTVALIDIYGTPYPDDIGPGKTYETGYSGPDLLHYTYVDTPQLDFPGLFEPEESKEFQLDIQNFPANFEATLDPNSEDFGYQSFLLQTEYGQGVEGEQFVTFNYTPHGYFEKPFEWTGRRQAPGAIQEAISNIIIQKTDLLSILEDFVAFKQDIDGQILLLRSTFELFETIRDAEGEKRDLLNHHQGLVTTFESIQVVAKGIIEVLVSSQSTTEDAIPDNLIGGFALGGDIASVGKAATSASFRAAIAIKEAVLIIKELSVLINEALTENTVRDIDVDDILPAEQELDLREDTREIATMVREMQGMVFMVGNALQRVDSAERALQKLIADGLDIQNEREIYRKRVSALIQGFRTQDAAFRIFRNEKLERYNALFNLAANYTYLAAKAFDFDTGLLHTSTGRELMDRIASARALGVLDDGEPQFAGSDTGDPGLSSILAEMWADWQVLDGRLGFNNSDNYGTTVSLRGEHFRVLPGTEGDILWRDILQDPQVYRSNILDDPDVRHHALGLSDEGGRPVPGFVIEFDTEITEGLNLFGEPLAAGDHAFSPSSYATKIFAAGVAFEGYVGMANPAASGAAISVGGGVSPVTPSVSFLDPVGLSATPYVYLLPVGEDFMRSPPLGDTGVVRSWRVEDVTVPLPYNIGDSDYSTKRLFQSSESLSEELFSIRKHQAFRPVSDASLFDRNLYGGIGGLVSSPFTSSRLIGRSVWNNRWKLVIPATSLLNDPIEGMERFVETVKDIQIHFNTYSYSGN